MVRGAGSQEKDVGVIVHIGFDFLAEGGEHDLFDREFFRVDGDVPRGFAHGYENHEQNGSPNVMFLKSVDQNLGNGFWIPRRLRSGSGNGSWNRCAFRRGRSFSDTSTFEFIHSVRTIL